MNSDKNKNLTNAVSFRLQAKDFEDFHKFSHLEYTQMAQIARGLVIEWLEKKRKKKN